MQYFLLKNDTVVRTESNLNETIGKSSGQFIIIPEATIFLPYNCVAVERSRKVKNLTLKYTDIVMDWEE